MHRRPLGNGRRLAAIGAVLILLACFLPWWQLGADLGLPPRTGNAFDGSGVLVFFVALAVIALLALPYAAGDVPVGLDRSLSFLILTVIGWLALVVRVVELGLTSLDALFPQRAYGLWIAVLGLILLSRAVYDIGRERRY
ncbi:MAG: hypothetical protein H0V73_09830 [Chloroflexi bacterium]|nr:hypothetical protein [Chloroflexota bacterium]